jgi:(p)ppGpp synthase/HD superfamily hydrolase
MFKDTKILYDMALVIAEDAHKGQFRNDGVTPYIEHPKQVAEMFDAWVDKAVAILHDVVEDTDLSLEDIRAKFVEYLTELQSQHLDDIGMHYYMRELGFILLGVKAMTYDKNIHEFKRDYLQGIIDAGMVKFKIADITCNLADDPTDYQKSKYRRYMNILIGQMELYRGV